MMSVLKQIPVMMLGELLQGIQALTAEADRPVRQLVIDSRKVQHGDVFLACLGQSSDGRHYIDQAIAQGAVAILWDSDRTTVPIPLSWRQAPSGVRVPCIAINNLTQLVGVLADVFYQAPSKAMYMVGVTGTNGKTSTTQFIAQALAPQIKCAVIGTLGWGYPQQLHASQNTTPDGITTQQWLAELRDAGAQAVAMEVSSHALDQARIQGVAIDCAVFTNLTHDHLDYHKDMHSYAQAKQKLFAWPTLKAAVINLDDTHGREFQQALAPTVAVLTYGMRLEPGQPDLCADQIVLNAAGLAFRVFTPWGEGNVTVPLFGRFNISNLLAALGVLLHCKLSLPQALEKLNQVSPVAGRMQLLRSQRHATVVIDYAHTPDALEQALTSLRAHVQGKLWCVFGCGGNRDQAKRPKMGAIAEQHAERVVITSDNPRHEDPLAIIKQIQSGFIQPDSVTVQADRRLAIHYALANARAGDIILIAGKGHETYQQVGETRLAFSDVSEVQAYLHEVGDHVA